MGMFDWLRRGQHAVSRLRPVRIGDGNLTVDLPEHFVTEREEGKTTVAYDPAVGDATARFSVSYVSNAQRPEANELGVEVVRDLARKHRREVVETGGKLYYTYSERSEERRQRGDMHYWIVGLGNGVVIASCWISRTSKGKAISKSMLSSMDLAIRSLRPSAVQKFRVEGEYKQEFLELSTEHARQLDDWREAAYGCASSLLGGPKFTGDDTDLQVVQLLLDSGAIGSNTLVLEGLGVVLGDILGRKLGLHWVTAKDSEEAIPVLRYDDSGIILYARDMIVRRVERGEVIDVPSLFNSLVEHVSGMIRSGRYQR